jgi:Fur family ferric uptake transcriptional regulator
MGLEPLPQEVRDRAESEALAPLCAVFRRRLRDEGLKYTPERAHILDAIIGMDGLFEAEQLLESLRTSSERVSKATVYRTIKLLQDAGIVQRVLLEGEHAYYQLVYGTRPHELLIRVDTGEIETIELPELTEIRDRICRERGLDPQGHRFQIYATGPGSA